IGARHCRRLPDNESSAGHQRLLELVGDEHFRADASPVSDRAGSLILRRPLDRGLGAGRRRRGYHLRRHSRKSSDLLSAHDPVQRHSYAHAVCCRARVDGPRAEEFMRMRVSAPQSLEATKPHQVIRTSHSWCSLGPSRLSGKHRFLNNPLGSRVLIRLLIGISAIALFSFSNASSAASPNDLQKKIEELIRASGAETVGVAYYDPGTGRELLINPDTNFHAASTMKVPVMMEIFRQVEVGKLSLDARLAINNDFKSIVDGSHYSLTADSDSEASLYGRTGQTETIRELMRLMITVSSNFATNMLIERVTPERVMDLMHSIGANNIRVLRGVEDGKAF